ncbi:MAG: hypothetical protein HN368_14780 [Spirochaetales bacterium]|nr:hypothetical protein [Spirochaetales bacterium]
MKGRAEPGVPEAAAFVWEESCRYTFSRGALFDVELEAAETPNFFSNTDSKDLLNMRMMP